MIYRAVMKNDAEAIDRVVALPGMDINIRGPEGQTPLFFAVMKGKTKAVKQLLKHGADAYMVQEQGFGPLDAAGFAGRPASAKLLLAHGLDPRQTRQDGFNPFHRAIWGNSAAHTETVKVFLEAGLSPNEMARAAKYGAQTEEVDVAPIDMVDTNEATRELLQEWVLQKRSSGL